MCMGLKHELLWYYRNAGFMRLAGYKKVVAVMALYIHNIIII